MSLEALLQQYGYPGLFVGAFLEGETVLVLAGFAAHCGYLHIGWVVLVAAMGSLAGDQFWFLVGRLGSRRLAARFRRRQVQAERIRDLLSRHPLAIMLGFRFLYGLRNVTPFVIGASGFGSARFLVLNAIGAALWASSVGMGGYVFGHTLELLLEDVHRYEVPVILGMAALGAATWSVRRLGPMISREHRRG